MSGSLWSVVVAHELKELSRWIVTAVGVAGDCVVDLAYHHPLDDSFGHISAAKGSAAMDMSGMFGNDEDFKPAGLLLDYCIKSA